MSRFSGHCRQALAFPRRTQHLSLPRKARFPPPESVKRAPSFLGVFLLLYWQQSLGNAQQRWEHLSLNHRPHVLWEPLLFPRGVSASPARSLSCAAENWPCTTPVLRGDTRPFEQLHRTFTVRTCDVSRTCENQGKDKEGHTNSLFTPKPRERPDAAL